MVQWLFLGAFTAKGPDSISSWGAKILQATQCSQRGKEKRMNLLFRAVTTSVTRVCTTQPSGSLHMLDRNLANPLSPNLSPILAERLREVELRTALRTLGLISLGLYSQYWLLLNVSGFRSPGSALGCMLITRSLLAHPYLHVNIFQVRPPLPCPLGRGAWGPASGVPGCSWTLDSGEREATR